AARQLARDAGPLGRLTHPREQFYPQLDRRHLKVCRPCEEIIYPAARTTDSYERPEASCHYCGDIYETRPYDPNDYASKESEAHP
ncbi:MAG TPA: hypothetical protein VMG62_00770, partial [Solirubrobacteraceae bacterium]|nr:hypothetical protein [Solirubrobacteraceae bacterium]